ncbi:PaaI family thioesterase [Pseudochelatococcus sp. B33]
MTNDNTEIEIEMAAVDTLRNPLLQHLGVRLLRWEPGEADFGLTIDERHLNRQSRLHGGVIATMLDVACGYAGTRQAGSDAVGGALTLTLNIGYLDGVAAGEVVARGRVVGGGRGIFFASGEVAAADGRLIATAQGAFKRLATAP